jgi:hypothetical protein
MYIQRFVLLEFVYILMTYFCWSILKINTNVSLFLLKSWYTADEGEYFM